MQCKCCKTEMRVDELTVQNGKTVQRFFCPNKNCPQNKKSDGQAEKIKNERITEKE